MMQSFLSLEIHPVSYTDHTQLTVLYLAVTLRVLSMFLYDKVMIFLLWYGLLGAHRV